MKEIPVSAIGLFARRRYWDIMGDGVIDELLAPFEGPFAPGGDDANMRIQGEIRQLEAHLIIALPGRAVGDRICLLSSDDLELLFGDERTRQRGAHQIATLVDSIRTQ